MLGTVNCTSTVIYNFSHQHPRFRINMKATFVLATVTALAVKVAGHATFQELWVNGVDQISQLSHLVAQTVLTV